MVTSIDSELRVDAEAVNNMAAGTPSSCSRMI